MFRSVAITRINQGLSFRPSGNSMEATIVLMLQEAQKDLEKGKTLPKFLIQEDQTLSLVAGTHTVAKPTGFLRESDETRIRYFDPTSTIPKFLERKYYVDAVEANVHSTIDALTPDEPVAPSVYVMRKSTIDFITTADTTYTLYWDYYKAAALLTTDVENEWLADEGAGANWLIGLAGRKIASSLRQVDAVSEFTTLMNEGRAACFGETLASEDASGPIQMGGNL